MWSFLYYLYMENSDNFIVEVYKIKLNRLELRLMYNKMAPAIYDLSDDEKKEIEKEIKNLKIKIKLLKLDEDFNDT